MWSSDFFEIVDLPIVGPFGAQSQKSYLDFIFTGLLPNYLRLNLMDYSRRLKDSQLTIRLQSYQTGFPPAKYHDLSLAARRIVPLTLFRCRKSDKIPVFLQ